MSNKSIQKKTVELCVAAVLMAMNIALSSFSIPVPGGHLYLNDIVICTAAIVLNPLYAFMVGGVGAFLGDVLFYPAAMFVSLIVHGLQAVVISAFSHEVMKNHKVLASGIGVTIGAIIMIAGYTFGRAYCYPPFSLEVSIMKLPYQTLQAVLGAVVGMVLVWKCGIKKVYDKTLGN